MAINRNDLIQVLVGTKAAVDALTAGGYPELGEPGFATDTKELFIGNGPDTPPSWLGGFNGDTDRMIYGDWEFHGKAAFYGYAGVPSAVVIGNGLQFEYNTFNIFDSVSAGSGFNGGVNYGGQNTTFSGAITLGNNNTAYTYMDTSGGLSHGVAVGDSNVLFVSGGGAAFGTFNTALDSCENSLMAGHFNKTMAPRTVAVGFINTVYGDSSAAFGFINATFAGPSVAMGGQNTVSGYQASSVGWNNTVNGAASSAWGQNNIISNADGAVLVGGRNTTAAPGSMVFGYGNRIVAGAYQVVLGRDITCVESYRTELGIKDSARLSGEGSKAWVLSLPAGGTLPTPSVEVQGAHADGTLPHSCMTFRYAAGNLTIVVNDAGTLKKAVLAMTNV